MIELSYPSRVEVFRLCGYIGYRHPEDLIEILELGIEKYYIQHLIPKPGQPKTYRRIFEPIEPLKTIQRKILKTILYRARIHPLAHAYLKNHDIFSNAIPHLQAKSMIRIDLKNAYESIATGKFVGIKHNPYKFYCYDYFADLFNIPIATAWLILRLTFISHPFGKYEPDTLEENAFLGQGPPTSPHLFNLALSNTYRKLEQLAKHVEEQAYERAMICESMQLSRPLTEAEAKEIKEKVKVRVTGYADDFVFSSTEPTIDHAVIRSIFNIFKRSGLTINTKKSRIIFNGNTNNNPLSSPGFKIINHELRLSKKNINNFRINLYSAGKMAGGDDPTEVRKGWDIKYGIENYIIRVYGKLPARVATAFKNGYNSVKTNLIGKFF